MANARGGKVVLGLRQRQDGSFVVHGVADPEGLERELWDLLHNREKVSANLLTEGDIRVERIEGKALVVIDIPPAPRSDRPVHIGRDPFEGTWIRGHEGDRKLPRERVRRMLADADKERPRDSLGASGNEGQDTE